ncbi:MAG: hypothetical protein WKF36_10535, partial [Candidatus Nitrosocosmicus sp.]
PAAEDATETSNGNPAAEDATETSNGNPAAEDATETSNGNPAAEDATETSNGNPAAEDATETSNGNPAAEDATETSNGNPAAEDEEKDLQSGGTESNAKPLTSEINPNAGIADKPSSGPQSQSPFNENSSTKGSPNLGTDAGVFEISPFYNSYDLPFTAVIPH